MLQLLLGLAVATFAPAAHAYEHSASLSSLWPRDLEGLWKREGSSNPSTVRIPLTVDNAGTYAIAVNMPQGYQRRPSRSYRACRYNSSESTTVEYESGLQNVTIPEGSMIDAGLIREDCFMRTENGSAWKYLNQTIVETVSGSSFLASQSSIGGALGLGTNSRDDDFSATIYHGWLEDHPTRTNFSFGMALNSWTVDSGSSADGGRLDWVAPDPAAYVGEPTYKSMIMMNSSVDYDWVVDVDAWECEYDDEYLSQSGGGMTGIFDPYYPYIYFPTGSAQSVYARISGSKIAMEGNDTIMWSLPCDTRIRLSITFNDMSFNVTEEVLVLQNTNGGCVGAIQGWSDTTDDAYLFGSTFISSVYLIFIISSSSQGTMGIAPRAQASSSNSMSKGAMAGTIIGSIVALALIVFIGMYIYYLRKRDKREAGEDGEEKEIIPFNIHPTINMLPSPQSSPLNTASPYQPYNSGQPTTLSLQSGSAAPSHVYPAEEEPPPYFRPMDELILEQTSEQPPQQPSDSPTEAQAQREQRDVGVRTAAAGMALRDAKRAYLRDLDS
ncbi:acid protease [Fistulina hepatica ATCC 64428]|uniref:Acid protease n=1 Tax=Fistulina hepatica ATCC 64428 TaxID=1128425 RepID=A0A0D7A5Q8_9AGAR|nr:acid protease [Fistulina hepatica ATCC 64428]